MLIIDGADLVGKTTLAKTLCKALNKAQWPHVYQHLSRLPDKQWSREPVENYRRLMNVYTVRDRFHMSSPVYAAVRGEVPSISPEQYRQVDRELTSIGGYTILIIATPELIVQRYQALVPAGREEMYSLDKILKANELFTNIAANGGELNGYFMRFDLLIHLDPKHPYADELQLKAYTQRLINKFPYPGANAT